MLSPLHTGNLHDYTVSEPYPLQYSANSSPYDTPEHGYNRSYLFNTHSNNNNTVNNNEIQFVEHRLPRLILPNPTNQLFDYHRLSIDTSAHASLLTNITDRLSIDYITPPGTPHPTQYIKYDFVTLHQPVQIVQHDSNTRQHVISYLSVNCNDKCNGSIQLDDVCCNNKLDAPTHNYTVQARKSFDWNDSM